MGKAAPTFSLFSLKEIAEYITQHQGKPAITELCRIFGTTEQEQHGFPQYPELVKSWFYGGQSLEPIKDEKLRPLIYDLMLELEMLRV